MNDYVVIYKDLILKYEFKKAVVLQFIIDSGNEYIGSPKRLSEELGVITYQQASVALRELIQANVLKRKKVTVRVYKYTINENFSIYNKKDTK